MYESFLSHRDKLEREIREKLEEEHRERMMKLRSDLISRKPAWRALRQAARYEETYVATKIRSFLCRAQSRIANLQLFL